MSKPSRDFAKQREDTRDGLQSCTQTFAGTYVDRLYTLPLTHASIHAYMHIARPCVHLLPFPNAY